MLDKAGGGRTCRGVLVNRSPAGLSRTHSGDTCGALAPNVVSPAAKTRQATGERLAREIRQLTTAIAAGGEMTALLDALRVREAERAALERAAHAESADAQLREVPAARLRAQLLERLADWRGLLRGQVTQAQQILRRLLAGPLVCTPQPERCYRLTGTATLGRLVEGQVPVMVASPICASWNRFRGWLRAVDSLRRAA